MNEGALAEKGMVAGLITEFAHLLCLHTNLQLTAVEIFCFFSLLKDNGNVGRQERNV